MSGKAQHLVIRYGPTDVHLAWLCVVVADWMDPDGHGARMGLRVMADRCRAPRTTVRRLLAQAVSEGWLAVDNPGGPRRQAVYSLGPAIVAQAVAARFSASERANTGQVWPAAGQTPTYVGPDTGQIATWRGPQTVDVDLPLAKGTPPRKGGGAPSPGEPASPPIPRHPPSCVCEGTGWVYDDPDGRYATRCPGT